MIEFSETPKKGLGQRQKNIIAVIFVIFLLFVVDVLLFSILHPVFASILVGVGLLIFLFMIFMMVSREPIPKDLERLKRDTERRAHVPGLGGDHGVLFLENGGPTPYQKEDEDY